MSPSIQNLGIAPTPLAIDGWMQELGLIPTIVGTSVQGRDIILYELASNRGSDAEGVPTVLFLSLEHGNEPMGLMSLLFAVELLHQAPPLRGVRSLFRPIVNVDAYTLNIEFGQGCRRTNLRSACDANDQNEPVWPCPDITQDGVDLKRNYPVDWEGEYAELHDALTCSYEYRGPAPFSEPETQAVRDVVLKNNVIFAMSFHSRRSFGRPPILFHPYSSARPFGSMLRIQARRYRAWSYAMNPSSRYITGTAHEAIHCTAGGSTVDYLHSINITAFVLESAPPCDSRWCPHQISEVMHAARQDGVTARRFVELIVHSDIEQDAFSLQRFWIVAVFLSVTWLIWKWRQDIPSAIRRLRAKEKQTEL